MTMDLVNLGAWNLPVFLLILFRLGGLLLSVPIFASAHLPVPFKAGLALTLAVSFYPLLQSTPLPGRMEPLSLLLAILGEVVLGVVIGFAARFFFMAVDVAGELAGIQMGLGIANVFDPQFAQPGVVVAQFMSLITVLTFLVLEGHHAFLEAIWQSFQSIPPGMFSAAAAKTAVPVLVSLFGSSLVLAMKLSSPVMVAVLLTNVGMGLLVRVVPQLNFLVVGLIFTVVIGLLALLTSLSFMTHLIETTIGQMRLDLLNLVRSLPHAAR